MSTLLQDTFTGTNGTNLTAHTMDVGGGWTADAGTVAIQSNAAQASALSGGEAIYHADPGQSDVTVSGTVSSTSGSTGAAAVIGRMQDLNNLWLANASWSSQQVQIYERVAGTYNPRASQNVTLNASTGYTLSLAFSGTSISATVNGVTANYTSSSLQTQTKCGLRFDATTLTFDDFLVTGAAGQLFRAGLDLSGLGAAGGPLRGNPLG